MTDEFVENALLFFLNDKVDVMNHDDLVRLCSSFYDEGEIKDAKRISTGPGRGSVMWEVA